MEAERNVFRAYIELSEQVSLFVIGIWNSIVKFYNDLFLKISYVLIVLATWFSDQRH